MNISTDPASVKEVQKAIAKLKHENARCVDEINTEILKVKKYWPPTILTSIALKIWESEETPILWKTSKIVELPQKESFQNVTTIDV